MKKTKKNLALLMLILPGFLGLNQVKAQNITNESWAKLSRYENENKDLKEKKIDVVFMGNSITEGWVHTDSSFFSQNNFVGRGISGQTTPQFLTRFRSDVIDLHPQIVVINGGINDIAQNTGAFNPSFTFGCIQSMAELAKANNIKVILTSILPAGNIPWNNEISDVPQKINQLNGWIKEYADKSGFTYVDYYSKMVAPDKSMIAEYTTDGVHVTPEGYKVMESLVKKAVDQLSNKKKRN